jgi:hypothetical protein
LVLEVSGDVVATAERMLSDAYELVLSGWCRGDSAQDECGRPIEPSSAFARKWSAPGALERVWRRATDDGDVALEAYSRASLALATAVHGVPRAWNDEPGRHLADVLDAFARAAEQLREEVLDLPHRGD